MWSDYSAIGLGINIPILMDLLQKAKVQQNQIDIDKLEIDIKDTKLGLDQAYQNAKAQIENSLATLESQKSECEIGRRCFSRYKKQLSIRFGNTYRFIRRRKFFGTS